jgi:RsiW-degrading membrane proteinase PrsW (M82 family)
MDANLAVTLAVFIFGGFGIISIIRESPPIVRVILIAATGLSFQLSEAIQTGDRSPWLLLPIALVSLPAMVSVLRNPTIHWGRSRLVELESPEEGKPRWWGWQESVAVVIWFITTSALSWLLGSLTIIPRLLLAIVMLVPLTWGLLWFVGRPRKGGESTVT